ncbi:30S ribosomal protein S3 [Candidatus Vidania fulgoroideorum]
MGNKINPNCYRVFLNNNWFCRNDSKNNSSYIFIYKNISEILKKNIGINNYEDFYVEFLKNSIILTIFSYKPGYLIGRKGSNISKIKDIIIRKFFCKVYLNVKEIFSNEICFSYFFNNLERKIKNCMNYKFFIKKFIKSKLKKNIKGIKIKISGRINGSEIARTETYKEGKISLSTIKNLINYKNHIFKTKYGIIGIKIWYCYLK